MGKRGFDRGTFGARTALVADQYQALVMGDPEKLASQGPAVINAAFMLLRQMGAEMDLRNAEDELIAQESAKRHPLQISEGATAKTNEGPRLGHAQRRRQRINGAA